MSFPKILATGTVTVEPSGMVVVEGFDMTNVSCREHARVAMVLAMQRISNALMEGLTEDQPKLSAID